jgi:cytochrome P450
MARAMLEEDPAQVEVIKDVTGQAYLAGIDTVYATIMSFFLAMLVYPDVQSRAQAEVDRVVGTNRLPELGDRKELPYVEGVVNECLRWLPVAPLGKSFFSALANADTGSRCTTCNDPR